MSPPDEGSRDMAERRREQELARAAEELHGATTDLLKLREVLEQFPETLLTTVRMAGSSSHYPEERPSEDVSRRAGYEAGLREQPEPRPPFLSGTDDPTLAERFEDELHGSESTSR